MAGSIRREIGADHSGSAPDPLLQNELGQGPSEAEWIANRVSRHRIGDAEIMPVSKVRKKGATPEGDQSF